MYLDKKTITLIWILIVVSTLGILDTAYLTFETLRSSDEVLFCTTGGCEQVLNSQYASFFDIPTSVFGLLFYLFVFGLSIVSLHGFDYRRYINVIFAISVLALLVSVYMTYLQYSVIGEFCEFCLASAVLVLAIFLLSVKILSQKHYG